MSLKSDLEHIVTAYDQKQSTKKNYNIYALAQYLKRVDEVLMSVRKGKSVKDAVTDGFNDRLRDFILKNLTKRGHIEVSEDVQEFEYTDFDRQTRNNTRPVPARYADNALALDEEDAAEHTENTVSYNPKTMKFSSNVVEGVQHSNKPNAISLLNLSNTIGVDVVVLKRYSIAYGIEIDDGYNVFDKHDNELGWLGKNGKYYRDNLEDGIDLSLDENVQQYEYTDFDRQTRNKNRYAPARYADNAMALDEEYDVVTLDRLQKIMNDAGVSDAEISRGIELSRLGYQRLAAQMNVNVANLQKMVNFLITKMRKDQNSDTIMGEGYEELFDDKRFAYEEDALGSVTIRDGNSGHEVFLRGHEATEFLNAVQSGAVDDQTLMGSYMPIEVIDEEVLAEGYEAEIGRDFGTYNFPWKIGVYKGTGTAEYSDEGIKIVSVRDDEGDEMNVDDQERVEITKQAVAFIGSV